MFSSQRAAASSPFGVNRSASRSGPPSLLAVAGDCTAGGQALAARWGRTLQDAVWGALLDLADERAGERAGGIAADDGTLVVHAAGGAR